jgi:hypothetical protein
MILSCSAPDRGAVSVYNIAAFVEPIPVEIGTTENNSYPWLLNAGRVCSMGGFSEPVQKS